MSTFKEAQLMHIRCELEALISERCGMSAANYQSSHRGESVAYTENAFYVNAEAMRAIAPNPHDFT